MDNSILDTIKKPLGASSDDTSFDADIIMHINSTLLALTQMGVGPTTGFYIQDNTTKWSEYVNDPFITKPLETYVYIKVRLVFDPPASQVLIDALKSSAAECEWRIREWIESKPVTIV